MYRNRSMKITYSPWFALKAYEGEKPTGENEPADLQAQIDKAVNAAVEGLKNTNKALKDEKKAVSDQLKAFTDQFESLGGAEGVKKLMEQRTEMLKTEEGKLLAEGKHEQWYEVRTSAMRRDHENQLKAVREEAAKIVAERDSTIGELHSLRLSVDVARARQEAKTRDDSPGLQEDIESAAGRVFTYDTARKGMVIKDSDGGVVFGKDGKTPKSVTEWLMEQQESRRHWWGDSVGGGARGSQHSGNQGKNPWSKEQWNTTEQGKIVREQGLARAEKLASAAGSKVGAVRPGA